MVTLGTSNARRAEKGFRRLQALAGVPEGVTSAPSSCAGRAILKDGLGAVRQEDLPRLFNPGAVLVRADQGAAAAFFYVGRTDRSAFDLVDTKAGPEGSRWQRQERMMSWRIPTT
jgi:hypothetical protein